MRKSIKTKGQNGMPITLTLIFIILLLLVSSGLLHGSPTTNNDYVIKKDDSTPIRMSLNLVKIYLKSSLDYSVYQSFIDMGDIEFESLDKTTKKLESDFADKILINLNKYTESGKRSIVVLGKEIALPSYKSIEMTKNANSISIKALPLQNITYQTELGDNDITFQKISGIIEKQYMFSSFGMLESAQKIFNSIKTNPCSNRKYSGSCENYECSASSKVVSGKCVTSVLVEYKKEKFPVIDGTDKILKYLGLTFIFRKP